MVRRIRRNSQFTSILYIIVGIIAFINPEFAVQLFALLLIVTGVLGLM